LEKLESFRHGLVWLMLASSFYVVVEPAPTDLLFVAVFFCFIGGGLKVSFAVLPMLLFLIFYNLGGLVGLVVVFSDADARMFMVTSIYMAAAALFLSFYVTQDTDRRMELIRSGLYVGGFLAAVFGIMDYFAVPGIPQVLPGRAAGLFKDPNVFSTFLIYPAILMLQSLLLGTTKRPHLLVPVFLTLLTGLFLSFSRGAWINFLGAAALLAFISFAVNPYGNLRSRMLLIGIAGLIIAFIGLSGLLSNEQVREMFTQRFSLVQSYDAGETGRFGNQLRSLPHLIVSPLGLGPLQFENYYGQAPHNVFLNGFASYGWLGGISYLLLIVATLAAGAKAAFTRSPLQNHAIAVFCPLAATIFQGIQIDTDHWRHFYWMLGIMWGIYAATLASAGTRNSARAFSPS
jgi:hypothetical protein